MAAATCTSGGYDGQLQAAKISPSHTVCVMNYKWDSIVTDKEQNNASELSCEQPWDCRIASLLDNVLGQPPCSLEIIHPQKGILAYGSLGGDLFVVNLNIEEGEQTEAAVDVMPPPPQQQYPVTCLQYHSSSERLFGLLDRGECTGWGPHDSGLVRVIDVPARREISALREILDHYELCTVLPLDPGGNELVGGSVKLSQDRWDDGAPCPRCNSDLPSSLCSHQRRSSNAALAFFDLRAGNAPGRMVSRHPLPHRSLYPRMQTAREHYLLASHAGAPLIIWDRRNLDKGPVACPDLDMSPELIQNSIFIPSDVPERRSNALFLSCHSNMLAGRADNGQLWVWDLSRILGWSMDDVINTHMGHEAVIEGNGGTYKPVKSMYVPFEPAPLGGLALRPRAEVWLGPDWVAATESQQLMCYRLASRDRKEREVP